MKVEKLTKIERNEITVQNGYINPFLIDQFRIGNTIGRNCTIMHETVGNMDCEYIIVIDTKTGNRVRITFDE